MSLQAVLDASAILAIVFEEPGADKLTVEILKDAVISAVNLAEVQSKLVTKGYHPDAAWDDALSLVMEVVPFSQETARIAGDLISQTKPYGLSLGDRSCLALAIALKGEVYTTERSWKKLKLGIPIHVIR